MYQHCAYCDSRLSGTADHRRVQATDFDFVAYDAERGRAWVACEVCKEWNLVPLDEVQEWCRSLHHLTSGAPEIGRTQRLAAFRVSRRLTVVRVGVGEQPAVGYLRLPRRYRMLAHHAIVRGAAIVLVAITTAGAVYATVRSAYWSFVVGALSIYGLERVTAASHRRLLLRWRVSDGRCVLISERGTELIELDLAEGGDTDQPVIASLRGEEIATTIEQLGELLAAVLPFINRWGASDNDVIAAVRLQQQNVGWYNMLRYQLRDADTAVPLASLPLQVRLCLEIQLATASRGEREALIAEIAAQAARADQIASTMEKSFAVDDP